MDWQTFAAVSGERVPRLVSELVARGTRTTAATPERGDAILDRLAAADAADRYEMLETCVRGHVVAVLALDRTAPLRDDVGLTELGMDSLMAVELRNRLKRAIRHPLPATVAFEHPTVAALTGHLAEMLSIARITPRPTSAGEAPAATSRPSAEADALKGLSEEELARSLEAELDSAGY